MIKAPSQHACNYQRMSSLGKPDVILETDASDMGWGASDGKTYIGGRWNETKRIRADNNEIYYLELWAIHLALRDFCSKFQNIHILIETDNTSLTYLNHMGGTKSHLYNELSKEIWSWCYERKLWITATYLKGVLHTVEYHYIVDISRSLYWT